MGEQEMNGSSHLPRSQEIVVVVTPDDWSSRTTADASNGGTNLGKEREREPNVQA